MDKMFPKKVETLLTFLVCAMLFVHLVSGKYPTCSSTQKNKIPQDCERFIRMRRPIKISLTGKNSLCCESVRAVPNRNMNCVVALLSEHDKKQVDHERILRLNDACEPALAAPSPPVEVKIIILLFHNPLKFP